MTENPEIIELESKRYDLEREIDEIDTQIRLIRRQCAHERADYPGITDAWWCQKCGGTMPNDTDARLQE